MNRSPSFAVLSGKPSRIERYSRPEYKSADPNWFIRRTFHVLNSNIRFGTWKVRRLNRAPPDSCSVLMGQVGCTPEPPKPISTPRESNIPSSDEIDVEEITVGSTEYESWRQQTEDRITTSNVYTRVLTKVDSGPIQTPLHSCAEPNSIKYGFGATLERRLIQTAHLRRT